MTVASAVSINGQAVTITNTGAEESPALETITLTNIRNPQVTGSTGTYQIETKTSGDVDIDQDLGVSADTITGGSLSSVSVTHSTYIAARALSATINFTTANPLAVGDKVDVTFDSNFDISGATFTSGNSGATVGAASSVLTVTLGTAVSDGEAVTLVIGNIVNPTEPETTDAYAIATKTSADVAIDNGSATGNAIVASFDFSAGAPVSSSDWVVNETRVVTWTTEGTVGTVDLAYATDADGYASWTTFETDCSTGGGGSCDAGAYTWTIPDIIDALGDPQTTPNRQIKVKVSDSDAGHPASSQLSDAFTVRYYAITWIVLDANGSAIANLCVDESATTTPAKPAWAVGSTGACSDGTFSGNSSIRYYANNNAGGNDAYTTNFDRLETGATYSVSYANWTADSDETITVTMDTAATAALTYEAQINAVYNATNDSVDISSWLTKKGVLVSDTAALTAISMNVYDSSGTLLNATDLGAGINVNSQGIFSGLTYDPAGGLDPSLTYTIKGAITYNGKDYTSVTGFVSSSVFTYEAKIETTYLAATDAIAANVWLERSGTTITDPGDMSFRVLDNTGTVVNTPTANYDFDGYDSTADGTYDSELVSGVYTNIVYDPALGLNESEMYTVKADLVYRGKTYNAVASFSKSELGSIATDVAGIQTDLTAQTGTLTSAITGQTTSLTSTITGQVGTVQASLTGFKSDTQSRLAVLETAVGAILPDTSVSLPSTIASEVATQLAKGVQSEIVTRPTTIETGSTVPIRFRTTTGLAPTITIYSPTNVAKVSAAAMTEIGTTGIYEYKATFSTAWGLGDFTAIVSESTKSSVDSIILYVVESLADGATSSSSSSAITMDTLYSRLNSMDTDMDNLTASVSTVSETTADVGTDVDTLLKKLGAVSGGSVDAETIGSIVGSVEAAVGAGSGDYETILGKLASIEATLADIGTDASTAAAFTTSATDQAMLVQNIVSHIKAALAGGDMETAESGLAELAEKLVSLKEELSAVPEAVTTGSLTETVKATLEELNQMASEKGLEGIVPVFEFGEGGGEAVNPEDILEIRNNVSELKSLMTEVRSLLDQEVNKPIVHGWLEGE